MEDDDLPRARGDAASKLSGESLDSYSRDELDQRIDLLELEIRRVQAHKARASAHMDAAAALFRPRGDG